MRFQKIGMRLKIVRSKNRACGCEPGLKYKFVDLINIYVGYRGMLTFPCFCGWCFKISLPIRGGALCSLSPSGYGPDVGYRGDANILQLSHVLCFHFWCSRWKIDKITVWTCSIARILKKKIVYSGTCRDTKKIQTKYIAHYQFCIMHSTIFNIWIILWSTKRIV